MIVKLVFLLPYHHLNQTEEFYFLKTKKVKKIARGCKSSFSQQISDNYRHVFCHQKIFMVEFHSSAENVHPCLKQNPKKLKKSPPRFRLKSNFLPMRMNSIPPGNKLVFQELLQNNIYKSGVLFVFASVKLFNSINACWLKY